MRSDEKFIKSFRFEFFNVRSENLSIWISFHYKLEKDLTYESIDGIFWFMLDSTQTSYNVNKNSLSTILEILFIFL